MFGIVNYGVFIIAAIILNSTPGANQHFSPYYIQTIDFTVFLPISKVYQIRTYLRC